MFLKAIIIAIVSPWKLGTFWTCKLLDIILISPRSKLYNSTILTSHTQRPAQRIVTEVSLQHQHTGTGHNSLKWRSARTAYIQMAVHTCMTRACIGTRYIIRRMCDVGLHGFRSSCALNEWDETTDLDHGSGCNCHTENGWQRYNQRCVPSKIVSCCVGYIRPVT